MRAVTFDLTLQRYRIGRILGRWSEAARFGGFSGLRLADVPEHPLPADDWVRVEVLKAGISSTDLARLRFDTSAALEPFGLYPATLGHEILGRVVETGPAVRGLDVGRRVVVDPVISCTARGFAAGEGCPSCALGRPATCERAGEEGALEVDGRPLRPGASLGRHPDLPGGWSERLLAHQTQVFPVDEGLSDKEAVLIEPLATGMHAVLGVRPLGPGPVLVIGSGPIALGTVWALRAAGYEGEIVAQSEHGHEARLAGALGADTVVSPGDEARQALVETGARAYMPIVGDEVFAGGGFPLIFDCVGRGGTIAQALRYAAPRGRVVMLGCAAEVPELDLTFLWARELDFKGFVGYGVEEWRGHERHTFEVTHDLLLETASPVDRVVTHVYPLSEYRQALSTAEKRRHTESLKVLLDPGLG
ncbi:MAG: zinc-binding dehydrogenase [Gemmatimonadota bacterium]|nr:zinc-binding dehydrogenase [Gemmatimonadota bacterium]